MPPHGFVDVHGVKARRVEAGQPHVTHNHETEGILGVAEAISQDFPGLIPAAEYKSIQYRPLVSSIDAFDGLIKPASSCPSPEKKDPFLARVLSNQRERAFPVMWVSSAL